MRYHLLAIVIAALVAVSCGGNGSQTTPVDNTVGPDNAVVGSYLDKPAALPGVKGVSASGSGYTDPDVDYTWKLIAGQSLEVGYVRVTNDDTNIYVEYVITEEGWLMHEAHTYVGCEPPETDAPGQFPYKVEFGYDNGQTSHMETIPLSDLDCAAYKGQFFVAAHAVVCTEGEEGEGYGGYIGGLEATIWAGQNNQAGTLSVVVDGTDLLVTYAATNGWEFGKLDLYVGTGVPGSAPGQYPYHYDPADPEWFDGHTFVFDMTEFPFWGEDGCLNIAAHADMRLNLGDTDGDGQPNYQTETGWAIPPPNPGDNFTPHGQGWGGYWTVCFTWDWFSGGGGGGYCETAWGGPQYLGEQGKEKNKWQWGDYSWENKWGGYFATCFMPLFDSTQTTMNGQFHPTGWTAYWKLWFTPDEYPWPDYPGNGNNWEGWCVDPSVWNGGTRYPTFYSCYDPDLPAYAQSEHWDVISWILNEHADTNSDYYYPWDVTQRAIHYFKYGNGGGMANGTVTAGTNKSYNNSQDVRDLVAAAKEFGEGYIPCSGDYYAVVCWPGLNGNGVTPYQMNIIAVDP